MSVEQLSAEETTQNYEQDTAENRTLAENNVGQLTLDGNVQLVMDGFDII
jgi:hypothetical protein